MTGSPVSQELIHSPQSGAHRIVAVEGNWLVLEPVVTP